ncbi:MAG: type 1 glutamine amidotransferase [Pseudomonadota bacterium]
MKIGILQTGKVNEALVGTFGEYPPMMEALFAEAAPDFTFEAWPVVDNVLPPGPNAADAWLVTGSRHGVYDPLPWMEPLKDFLRRARAAHRPVLGICFGHQIVAEAFGGRAVKSDKGWGLGHHTYRVLARPGWMADAPAELGLHALHQDQVVELPSDATLLAESAFCPMAMLAYGDPEAPDAVTVQPHPEFDAAFTGALIARIAEDGRAPRDRSDEALAALDGANTLTPSARAFARWAASFLRQAATRADAA